MSAAMAMTGAAGGVAPSRLLQAAVLLQREPRLSVLIFHRVLAQPDPLHVGEPTADEFEARMRWVAANFHVIGFAEAVDGIRRRNLRRRTLCITFDDGYADNHDVALPILRRLGLQATFFVATGYLDGGIMFNDAVVEAVRLARGPDLDLQSIGLGRHRVATIDERRRAIGGILPQLKYLQPGQRQDLALRVADLAGVRLPTNLMMTSEQVAALDRAGMEIGAHTVSHPILARVGLEAAREEVVLGRRRLEELTGTPVRFFAYPNGCPARDYRHEHAALVRDLGFEAAVSTAWGAAPGGADVFQIPRFTPWDRTDFGFGQRLVRNLWRSDYERV